MKVRIKVANIIMALVRPALAPMLAELSRRIDQIILRKMDKDNYTVTKGGTLKIKR